jgi:endonuclease I
MARVPKMSARVLAAVFKVMNTGSRIPERNHHNPNLCLPVVAAEVEVVDFKKGPMRTFGLLVLIILLTLQVTGQAPAGYYDEAYGLDGTELQAALHEIIKDHQVQTYASLYGHFQSTDRKPDLSVWDMYSDVPGGTPPYVYYYNSGDECGNYNGEGQCYNREHSFPQSWFGGSVLPMHTDLFHLYPTDGYVNNRRANYPFGEVSNATWTSQNGSKVGVTIQRLVTTALCSNPLMHTKAILPEVISTCQCAITARTATGREVPMTNGSQLKPWALALMMEWHENDPVSAKETNRNNAVYAIQQNRNPFIDYPEFVAAIWGDPSYITEPGKRVVKATVYPVPAGDQCYVSFSEPITAYPAVIVYDGLGRQLNMNYRFAEGTITIETSDLARGFYLVSIGLQNPSPLFVKILK